MVASVLEVFQSKGVQFTPSGKDYLIKCLNPDHQDNHPSLRIDKLSGMGHCFACGYKVNLFKYYGIITNNQSAKISALKEKIYRIFSEVKGLSMPPGSVPYTHVYRGISIKTMQKYEAFTTASTPELKDRVVFPLRDTTGKICLFIGRHFDTYAKPKYRLYPGGVEPPLFPGKLSPINGTIILVEGIFDALNLIDKGIENVAATMGTTTLIAKGQLHKEKITQLKLQGITKIYILFDGDKSGRDNAELLKDLLLKAEFFAETVDLEDDEDPGSMSLERVNLLKRILQ